ncbi:MAG: hypothetical protein SGPRY_006359 [Prymnesium sp.]
MHSTRLHTKGLAYSCFACLVTLVWCLLLFIIRPDQFRSFSADQLPLLLLIAVSSMMDLSLSNLAISLLSAPVQQIFAASTPIFTIALEFAVFGEVKQPVLYVSATAIVIGTSIAGFGQSLSKHHHTSDTIGIFLAILSACFSSAKLVLLRIAIRTAHLQISPVLLLFWTDTFSFIVTGIWSLASLEMTDFSKASAGISRTSNTCHSWRSIYR